MKKKEISNEKLMFEIAQENKKLSEPLTRALKEVEKLRHELANYQKDKMSLQNAKSRLHVLETQLRDLTWEHEVLEQRFHHVEKERNELFEKFESTIYDVQQKSGFKNILLERKLQVTRRLLYSLVEASDTQMHPTRRQSMNPSRRRNRSFQRSSMLLTSTPTCLAPFQRSLTMSLTPKVRARSSRGALSRWSRLNIRMLLADADGAIKDLQYELARVTKAHNDVIRVYESKLTEFGCVLTHASLIPRTLTSPVIVSWGGVRSIPVEELGFRPLVTSTGTGE